MVFSMKVLDATEMNCVGAPVLNSALLSGRGDGCDDSIGIPASVGVFEDAFDGFVETLPSAFRSMLGFLLDMFAMFEIMGALGV
mmetsp:Transcript_30656/g.46436  ORF Transcript_30656/g.46436 Transcript_30656/m.46436 type:complete len:84 (-) Transcript_30656:1199-1450(-)